LRLKGIGDEERKVATYRKGKKISKREGWTRKDRKKKNLRAQSWKKFRRKVTTTLRFAKNKLQ